MRPFCDALYPSKLYPASHILTGEQGKSPGYDALKIMCESCRKRGLSLHAWINPYRVTASQTPARLSADNPYRQNPSIGIQTASGIILTGTAKEKPQIAEVVAVGPGGVVEGKEVVMEVKVGDKVITSKYAGTEVKFEGEEYTILKQSDILAIVL